MTHVLVVDDDVATLNIAARVIKNELGVIPAAYTSARKALRAAKHVHFDIALCDYNMPEMDGITFLDIYRQLQPESPRFIMSDAHDHTALLSALRNKTANLYVEKPVDGPTLTNSLRAYLNPAFNFSHEALHPSDCDKFQGERRRHIRLLLSYPVVVVTHDDTVLRGHSIDISFSGAHVNLDACEKTVRLSPKCKLIFMVDSANESMIELTAEVERVANKRIAFRFDTTDPVSFEKLRALLTINCKDAEDILEEMINNPSLSISSSQR